MKRPDFNTEGTEVGAQKTQRRETREGSVEPPLQERFQGNILGGECVFSYRTGAEAQI